MDWVYRASSINIRTEEMHNKYGNDLSKVLGYMRKYVKIPHGQKIRTSLLENEGLYRFKSNGRNNNQPHIVLIAIKAPHTINATADPYDDKSHPIWRKG